LQTALFCVKISKATLTAVHSYYLWKNL